MADERTVAMIVNDLYYAQKDGCHKHVGTGRICYGCVEDALTAERKEVATLRARVAELERERDDGDMTESTRLEIGPDFHCRVCGKDVDMAPADLTEQAVCEEHCPDHNYRYDKFERRHVCESCGKPAPEDFYYD